MRRVDLLKEKLEFLKQFSPDSIEIQYLEDKIKQSKKGRSSKNKGANFERKIVNKLNELFPDLKFGRTASSGGYMKGVSNSALRGDVVCYTEGVDFLLHLELKNHKNGWTAVQEWFKQAEDDCIKGKIPVLIMHQNLVRGKFKSQDFVMLKFDDFFTILDGKKVIKMF